MSIRRRQFLGGAALASAALASPGWLSRAFAQDRACGAECDEAAALAAAFRRAQRAGKPLLVLVIPVAPEQRYIRGAAFGELINHGDDATLARLALAEVVCAKMAALRTLVPQVVAESGTEPLFVLVETDAVPARATPFSSALVVYDRNTETIDLAPSNAANAWQRRQDELTRRENEIIDQRLGMLRGLLDRALAPDARTLVRRALQARARLAARDAAALDALLAGGGVPAVDAADRAAAIVAVAASVASDAARQRLDARLGAGARARLRDRPVPGSRWARHSGCGTTIENAPDSEQMMVGCGMGHVAERSQRFLYLFSRNERDY